MHFLKARHTQRVSLSVEQQLFRVQAAIKAQSWQEAWGLLEQVNPDYRPDSRHLGTLREDFELLAATCLRHRGQLDQAEQLYRDVLLRLQPGDERVPDVLVGLADCLHAEGEIAQALQLGRAAEKMPMRDKVMAVRVLTLTAHLLSHIDLRAALQRYEWIQDNYAANADSSWANYLFWYGDCLLVDGQYDRAVEILLQAHKAATSTGALVTTADCLRRIPLARALSGQDDFALRGMGDLNQSIQLYELAGDRGSVYVHTEAGEVYRAIGRVREAEKSFSQGLWASRSIKDQLREAHNLMGLFELGRLMGGPQDELLRDADKCYERVGSEWGRLHVLISRALCGQDTIQQARQLIQDSCLSEFKREQELLGWISATGPEQWREEMHLMNYP